MPRATVIAQSRRPRFRPLLAGLLLLSPVPRTAAASAAAIGRDAVVQIFVTSQRENTVSPWQGGPQASGTGTGFIIAGRRLLTNAHVVSDVRFLEVQKSGDARRYPATVAFIAHDCDLALLAVDDPAFFAGTTPLPFADRIPTLNDEVLALGYPLGGNRLSVTKGIVSRIDYAGYSHSGVDQHLVLQVDAAINPGNSGGPVLFNKRVVGLAFQGLAAADNIGYAIPLPVIRHFLDDIADGHYHGYPELGVGFLSLRNPAMRADLGVPSGAAGIVIHVVDPFGAGHDLLRPRDVLLAVDGHPLAEDGSIVIGSETVLFAEILERKQWGESIAVDIWRDRRRVTLAIPLTNPTDPFAFRNQYDVRPPYLMVGGLVFSVLSQELLETQSRSSQSPHVQRWHYVMENVKRDGLYEGRDAFVVLMQRLPHPVNAYADEFLHGIVERVNGKAIRNLHELDAAFRLPAGAHHEVQFVGTKDPLVLNVDAARRAEDTILETYRLPSRSNLEDQP